MIEIPQGVLDNIARKQFEIGGKMPLAWTLSAESLKRAADLVFDQAESAYKRNFDSTLQRTKIASSGTYTLSAEEEMDLHDTRLFNVYGLLMGYAIENLAKGVLVARDPGHISKEGQFKLTNHDIRSLVENVLGTISNEEGDVLDLLETYVLWVGRYPIPRKWTDIDMNRCQIQRYQEIIADLYIRLLSTLTTYRGRPIAAP